MIEYKILHYPDRLGDVDYLQGYFILEKMMVL